MKRLIHLMLWSLICLGTFLPGLALAQLLRARPDTLPGGVIVYKSELQALANELSEKYHTDMVAAKKKPLPLLPLKPDKSKRLPGEAGTLMGLGADGLPLFYYPRHQAQAVSINTNKVWSGGGMGYDLAGRNVRMGVWEPGTARTTHQEFQGRALWADTGAQLAVFSDHATHVSGIMVAGGVNARAKGMAYLDTLRVRRIPNDVAEMAAEGAAGMLVSNHSYGPDYGWTFLTVFGTPDTIVWLWQGDTTINYNYDWRHGYYDMACRNVDQVCYNAPYYLPFIAAGNETGDGPNRRFGRPPSRVKGLYRTGALISPARYPPKDSLDDISGFTLAKNPIVIGCVDSLPPDHTAPLAGSVRSSFSCLGPADDGRIKPDVCAHGGTVFGPFRASNTTYGNQSGTSQASPSAAGSAALLQEQYKKIYSVYMRAATLKGLIIHTADECGGTPGPDYYMGYGLMNTAKAATNIAGSRTSRKHQILERNLANGVPDTIKDLIHKGGTNNPIRITLSWYDQHKNPLPANRYDSCRSHLINDLDVRLVRKSDGKLYLPWVLDGRRANRTNPARKGNDTVNVVEVIDTTVAPPGEYYVVVSHKRTLAPTPQAYSLLISGFGDTIQASRSTLRNSFVSRVQLGVLDNNSLSAGCASYSDFTYLWTNLCSGKKYKVKVSTGACTTATNKIIKAYLDYNNDQYLDEATEKIVESDLVAGNTTWEKEFTVTPPLSMTSDYYPRLRIVMREVVAGENLAAAKAATRAYGTYAKGETEDYSVRLGVVNQNYTSGFVTLDSTYSYVSLLNSSLSAFTGNKTVKVYCGCSVSYGAKLLVESPMKMYHDFSLNDTSQLVLRVPMGIWTQPDSGAIRGSVGSKMTYSIHGKFRFDYPSYVASRSGNALPDTVKDLWVNGTGAGQSFNLDKNVGISRELELNHAILNLNSKTVRLLAGPSGTARIARVTGTGNINSPGSFISNLYIPGTAASWRFLSMPFGGKSFSQWTDNLRITSPVAGSNVVDANLDRCTIFKHLEGADVSNETEPEVNGWRAPNTNALTVGIGFRVWLNGTFFQGKKIVDVNGQPIIGNGADATQPYPFTLTNTPTGYNGGGWNFLGNPYLSPVDWDGGGWTRAGVDNQVHVWNGVVRSYASYVGGLGVNGGNRYIANQQGFFVHANNATPSLTVSELSKPLFYVNSALMRSANVTDNTDILRMKLQATGLPDDEAIFRQVEGATTGFDAEWDANKLPGSGLNLACRPTGGPSYSICAYPKNTGTQSMPLSIGNNPAGSMALKFENVNSFAPPAVIYLADHYLNTIQQVTNNLVYAFQVNSDAASQGDTRLELQFVADGATANHRPQNTGFTLDVWPNPGTGVYSMNFGNLPAGEEVEVEIANANGRRVQGNRRVIVGSPVQTFALTDLPNGMYIIRVTSRGEIKNLKIVKE